MKPVELSVNKVNGKGASVTLQNVRLTFVYLDTPQKDIDGNPDKGKYSVTGIIPAREFPAIKKEFAALFQDILKQSEKVPGKVEREKAYKNAMADGKKGSFFKIGNEQTDKAGKVRRGLEDAYTFTATMDAVKTAEGFAPKFDLILRDRKNKTIPEHAIKAELYSGVYAHVAMTISPFNYLGNQGLKAYLNGVLKTADGEKLSGSDPFAAFAPAEDEEEEDTNVSFDDEEKPAKKKGRK